MTKLTKLSRLAELTAVLVASAALIGSVGIANAKGGDHHQSHNVQSTGTRPHFVISGQPANVKRVTRTTKTKELAEKKKGCGKIIVPTAEFGVSSKNPVGSTIPTLPSQADGSKPNPKGPSRLYDGDAIQRRHDVRNIQWQGTDGNVYLTRHNHSLQWHE
jgi:hypothetical protein